MTIRGWTLGIVLGVLALGAPVGAQVPDCERASGPFAWSCARAIPGMACTQILEPADPNTWADNYLCVPPQAPVLFQWSYAGPVPGLQCVQWNEPADPHTWADNFLCWAGIDRSPRNPFSR